MGTHFSKRGGHSGVMAGHEVMAYAYLSGTQCQPKRRRFSGDRRRHSSAVTLHQARKLSGKALSVPALSRSPSPPSLRREYRGGVHNEVATRVELLSQLVDSSGSDSGEEAREERGNIEIDVSSIESGSEMESDSGISVNLSHFDGGTARRGGGGGEAVTVAQVINERAAPPSSGPPAKKEPQGLSSAIRAQFEEEFCNWYEPNTEKKKTHNRRKSSTRSLHQKLVVSTSTNTKKAARIDMDDRAKMLQYFAKSNDDSANVSIEELFQRSWRLPMAGPRVPSVVTIQAPAGIGKSSMLKYMCLKWSAHELWSENFEILIFIECRTLNYIGPMTCREFISKHVESIATKIDPELDIVDEIERQAASGRLLFLLDGLDEITGVASLSSLNPKYNKEDTLTPLELTQAILAGRLAPGAHVIVTSRPHTLTYLQASRWFTSLEKRSLALDIQGLSEEGVCSFIHSFIENKISPDNWEVECTELCPCRTLQQRARADRYIFSLASNPFYLWLICTIFYEAGEGYVPTTLTQLYTWVIIVFSNQWQNAEAQLELESDTVTFLRGFAQLCYHLVQTGSIKASASLDNSKEKLVFPKLKLSLDLARAQTFGMMVVSQANDDVECEFRHLSLAEYLTAIHVHTTGQPLKGFAKDRKELILQYLSGLASPNTGRDQKVVENFLSALDCPPNRRDPLFYLNIIQKMKGEWYNQEGLQKQMLFMRCAYESQVDQLTLFPFPGLKIINIRGSALLTLDLIIINHFVTKLQPENQLLELSLRDQLLCASGLRALLPCLHHIRTVRLNGRAFTEESIGRLVEVASEVSLRPDLPALPGSSRRSSRSSLCRQVRSNLRELFLHDISPSLESDHLEPLRVVCAAKGIKTNLGPPTPTDNR